MDRTGGLSRILRWFEPLRSRPGSPAPRADRRRASCARCKIQAAVLDAYREAVQAELTRAIDLALAGDARNALALARRFADEPVARQLLALMEADAASPAALSALSARLRA